MCRIILIVGEPKQGKSYLAGKICESHKAELVHLDTAYCDFIKEKHKSLHLPDIACVVSQHYETVLTVHRLGKSQWKKHVIKLISECASRNKILVVEGYLLMPIMEDVLKNIPKGSDAVTVIVKDRRYYIESPMSDLLSWYL